MCQALIEAQSPLPKAQIPLLHPHAFQTKANPRRRCARPLRAFAHSQQAASNRARHTSPFICSSRAPPSAAVPAASPCSRVPGRGRGSGSALRSRGGGWAKGPRGPLVGRRGDVWGREASARQGGEETGGAGSRSRRQPAVTTASSGVRLRMRRKKVVGQWREEWPRSRHFSRPFLQGPMSCKRRLLPPRRATSALRDRSGDSDIVEKFRQLGLCPLKLL